MVATYRGKLGQVAAATCSSKPELGAAETCSNKVGGKELVYGIPHKASQVHKQRTWRKAQPRTWSLISHEVYLLCYPYCNL